MIMIIFGNIVCDASQMANARFGVVLFLSFFFKQRNAVKSFLHKYMCCNMGDLAFTGKIKADAVIFSSVSYILVDG